MKEKLAAFHVAVIEWIRAAQKYAKFWVAVIGGVLVVITGTLPFPAEVQSWITAGLAILTAFSVYRFPNAPADD